MSARAPTPHHPAMLYRIGRSVLSRTACVLLVIAGFAAGSAGAAQSVVPALPEDCPAWLVTRQLDAQSFETRLPFLPGSGSHASAPFETPPLAGLAVESVAGGRAIEHVRATVSAGIRIRMAKVVHARVARTLAAAHAGPRHARSTPPPASIS